MSLSDAVAPEAEAERFTLAIHSLLQTTQNENGLRHRDYRRYRHYLTRRLSNVRHRIGLVYGKGKVFVKKDITADNAKTVDHLLVLLLDAERAWSYAMELKDESSLEGKHKLKHMAVAKFAKAAKWADQLRALCSVKADPQTALEATAYADYMTGQLLLERESWSQAVVKLLSARTIYTELSAVGSLHDQDMFASRLQDLDPPIRFCKFNAGMTSESADIDIFSASPDLKAKFDEMRAKKALDSAHSFSTSSGSSSGGMQVLFAGKFIPVDDDQVQVQCSLVQQAMEKVGFRPTITLAVSKESDKARDQAFSAALSAIDASSAAVSKASAALTASGAKGTNQRVTAASSSGKVSEAKAALGLLKNYFAFQRLVCLYMKNIEVVSRLLKSMPSVVGLSIHSIDKASVTADREKEAHKVQEVAHLFDQQLTLVRDILAVPGVETFDLLKLQFQASEAFSRCYRACFIGESYSYEDKWAEAFALTQHAEGLVMSARDVMDNFSEAVNSSGGSEQISSFTAALAAFESGFGLLTATVRGSRYRVVASAAQRSIVETSEGFDAIVSNSEHQTSRSLLRYPLRWNDIVDVAVKKKGKGAAGSKKTVHVADLPPVFEPIPAKPVFFDIAFNYIDYPNIDERAGVKAVKKATHAAEDASTEDAGVGGIVGVAQNIFGWLRG